MDDTTAPAPDAPAAEPAAPAPDAMDENAQMITEAFLGQAAEEVAECPVPVAPVINYVSFGK